jgi:hypothetical protein
MRTRLSPSTTFVLLTTRKPPNPHPNLTRFLASSRKMSTQTSPTFSSNYSPEQRTKDLSPLLRGNGGRWSLIESGKGVERSFKFKTFKKTWVRVSLLHPPYIQSKSYTRMKKRSVKAELTKFYRNS